MTITDDVLNALQALLETAAGEGGPLQGVTVAARNSVLAEEVGPGGLIIVRDGDLELEDPALLGGFSDVYYTHGIEIELYACGADADVRNARYTSIIAGLGRVLEQNRTIGGRVFGMTYGQAAPADSNLEGAGDIKSGTVTVSVEYAAATPLG